MAVKGDGARVNKGEGRSVELLGDAQRRATGQSDRRAFGCARVEIETDEGGHPGGARPRRDLGDLAGVLQQVEQDPLEGKRSEVAFTQLADGSHPCAWPISAVLDVRRIVESGPHGGGIALVTGERREPPNRLWGPEG